MGINETVIRMTEKLNFDEEKMKREIHKHWLLLKSKPLPIHVLTMTVTASTNLKEAESSKIRLFFENEQIPIARKHGVIIRPPKQNKRISRKPRKSFQNSVALQFTGDTSKRKCIKIFKNARLHMTGVLSGHDLLQTLAATNGCLEAMTNMNVNIDDYQINMINVQFYAGVKLDLPEIWQSIDELMNREPAHTGLISSVAYDR